MTYCGERLCPKTAPLINRVVTNIKDVLNEVLEHTRFHSDSDMQQLNALVNRG